MSDHAHNHQLPNGDNHTELFMNGIDSNNVNELSSFAEGNGEPKGPPQACLFVASLAPETSEEALKDFFIQSGVQPLKVKVLKDRSDRARPYAFVQFKSEEEANLAIQNTNNRVLDGRRIRVERAKVNRTLFIAKMDKSLNSTQLKEIVETYGPVENITIIKNHQTNKSKGCGFIKFIYREDAMNAYMSLKTSQKKWVIEWATSSNDPESLGIDRNNIFVGGLNPALVTKELIEKRFGQYGRIDTISLVNKDILDSGLDEEEYFSSPLMVVDQQLPQQPQPTTTSPLHSSGTSSASPSPNMDQLTTSTTTIANSGRSAFAFLRYAEPSGSALAIEHENGAEWLDRRIRVQYCESQEMKNKRRATKYFTSVAQYNTAHAAAAAAAAASVAAQYYRPMNPHSIPNGPHHHPMSAHHHPHHPLAAPTMMVMSGMPGIYHNVQAFNAHPHPHHGGLHGLTHPVGTVPHHPHHHPIQAAAASVAAAAAPAVLHHHPSMNGATPTRGMSYPHVPSTTSPTNSTTSSPSNRSSSTNNHHHASSSSSSNHHHHQNSKGNVTDSSSSSTAAAAAYHPHAHASPYLPPYPLMNMNLNHPAAAAAAGMNMNMNMNHMNLNHHMMAAAYTPQSWLYTQHAAAAAYPGTTTTTTANGYSTTINPVTGLPNSGSDSPTGISPTSTPVPPTTSSVVVAATASSSVPSSSNVGTAASNGLNVTVGSVSTNNGNGNKSNNNATSLHSLRHQQQQLADQFSAEDLLDHHESVLANSLAAISLERAPRW